MLSLCQHFAIKEALEGREFVSPFPDGREFQSL
jgi:hypothetical protein